MTTIRPGDVVSLGKEASVQFAGDRGLVMRLVSVSNRPTYHGWVWITGYILNGKGEAIDKREVYVIETGLRIVSQAPPSRLPVTRPRSAPSAATQSGR